MSQKSFSSVAGTVFLIVAIIHALRLLNGWALTLGNFNAPVWVSWVGVLVGGYLAYQGLRRK